MYAVKPKTKYPHKAKDNKTNLSKQEGKYTTGAPEGGKTCNGVKRGKTRHWCNARKNMQRAPSAGKHVTGASAGKHARRTKLSRGAVCCELFNKIKSVKFSEITTSHSRSTSQSDYIAFAVLTAVAVVVSY